MWAGRCGRISSQARVRTNRSWRVWPSCYLALRLPRAWPCCELRSRDDDQSLVQNTLAALGGAVRSVGADCSVEDLEAIRLALSVPALPGIALFPGAHELLETIHALWLRRRPIWCGSRFLFLVAEHRSHCRAPILRRFANSRSALSVLDFKTFMESACV
jgi:hypothetical protein